LLYCIGEDGIISILFDDIYYTAPYNRQIRVGKSDSVFAITNLKELIVIEHSSKVTEYYKIGEISGDKILDFQPFNSDSLVACLSNNGVVSILSCDSRREIFSKVIEKRSNEIMCGIAVIQELGTSKFIISVVSVIKNISSVESSAFLSSSLIMIRTFLLSHRSLELGSEKILKSYLDIAGGSQHCKNHTLIDVSNINEAILLNVKTSNGLFLLIKVDSSSIEKIWESKVPGDISAFEYDGERAFWVIQKDGSVIKYG